MKENEDKQLEKLVDQIMKSTTLESPSFDFTSKVMSQALALKTNNATVYKPLISKPILIGILGSFIALIIYLFTTTKPLADSSFSGIDFNLVSAPIVSSIFKFSEITIYTTVFATIALFVQIYFFKKQFEKQLE
ncbi:hypothetical protein [Flavobacterium sp. '19STA2R22 D10 B1']|uniref:hypothetical protein n=1 Tax=Flavobacterium aerium TaxID=3037261 RepID=UPI00278C3C57|nr:hypothetical protein [Flavobacterium sp. '19STA2R22 D10 B1']